MQKEILLPAAFTDQHRRVVERYIRDARLKLAEWRNLFEALDLLAHASIRAGNKVLTFADIYQMIVPESVIADFLSHLLELSDTERDGVPLKATYARAISERLSESHWYDPALTYSLYLRAYCIYWWDSFAKGYIFEVAVYRDLKRDDVAFIAHDITDPDQRLSTSDLLVNNWRGDIKTSTYFLATARTRILRHDFYITRLYDHRQQRRVWVVIMQPQVWTMIDGETETVDLNQSYQCFPAVSHFYHHDQRLIVAAYKVWKAKMLIYQQEAL